MPDEMCRERVVERVVSTLTQLTRPRSACDIFEFFTTAIIHAVETGVPPPPRRHRRHELCASAETSAAF